MNRQPRRRFTSSAGRTLLLVVGASTAAVSHEARGQSNPVAVPVPASAPAPEPVTAPSAAAPPTPKPPPFRLFRYDEDYSYLADPTRRTNFLDSIKYIPLDDDHTLVLSLGGEARTRYEYFSAPAFGLRGPGQVAGGQVLI